MSELYLDKNQSIEARVADLIARMTTEEKVAQINSTWSSTAIDSNKKELRHDQYEAHFKHGMGQLGRPGPSSLEPRDIADLVNQAQEWFMEKTRLSIPVVVHEEALSGVVVRRATMFPQAINYGSTWDPELVAAITVFVRKSMLSLGLRQTFSPLLDISRDARCGRIEETFSEDHYLVAAIGCAYIKGLQGSDLTQGVAATGKHYAGYGFTEGGRNAGSFRCGPREFRDEVLFPFEAAVKEAKLASIMTAYHEIDGIPCSASHELIAEILREEWGFDGLVVSDYGAVAKLVGDHFTASEPKEACKQVIEAGLDAMFLDGEEWVPHWNAAVREGLISPQQLDETVSRILRFKFRLGLFDQPYVDPTAVSAETLDTKESRELAYQCACESIVLLKNDGNALPLAGKVQSIALVGPNADSGRGLLGDYVYTVHTDDKYDTVAVPSVLEALKAAYGKSCNITYAKGCAYNDHSKMDFPAAVSAAQKSDVIIAVMGEKSAYLSGEGYDRDSLNLAGVQEDLVIELAKTGKPIILVLVNGRPLSLVKLEPYCAAIVEAWYPGEEGARAIVSVLFGDHNPSGKLPVGFPKNEGQIPVHYDRRPTGMLGCYMGIRARPQYPFGHGLSYTSFSYKALELSGSSVACGGTFTVSFTLENTGDRDGSEVVQLYIHDVVASVSRPMKELKAFRKVFVKKGESKRIVMSVPTECLAFHNKAMKLAIEAGKVELMIGSSSEDIRLSSAIELTGSDKILPKRSVFFSTTTVA